MIEAESQRPAKDASLSQLTESQEKSHEPGPSPKETTTLTPMSPVASLPIEGKYLVPKPEGPETSATGGEQVTRRLAELRNKLSQVRIEASLVRRLIHLEEEERRITQDIIRLESYGFSGHSASD